MYSIISQYIVDKNHNKEFNDMLELNDSNT